MDAADAEQTAPGVETLPTTKQQGWLLIKTCTDLSSVGENIPQLQNHCTTQMLNYCVFLACTLILHINA